MPASINEETQDVLRKFKRQALHAWRLGLTHPETEEYCEWEIPLPDDINQLLDSLRATLALKRG